MDNVRIVRGPSSFVWADGTVETSPHFDISYPDLEAIYVNGLLVYKRPVKKVPRGFVARVKIDGEDYDVVCAALDGKAAQPGEAYLAILAPAEYE